jgi:RNA polymerase sigma-70 factor (ECF subfamily)
MLRDAMTTLPVEPPPLERAMARFAAGEDAALGKVYDLAAPAVFTFLLRLCRERPLAEDLTQETFLRIHRARGLYRAGAAVLPWAYTIARRLFLDAVRSRRANGAGMAVSLEAGPKPGGASDGTPPAPFDVAAAGPSAEQLLADVELSRIVDDALGRLPEAQASAFRLLKGEGLSVAEAAAVMGTTKGAIKLRAHRAYEALRTLLSDDLSAVPAGRKSPPRERGEKAKTT